MDRSEKWRAGGGVGIGIGRDRIVGGIEGSGQKRGGGSG